MPLEVARARYQARAAQRHAGHLDADRSEAELWGQPSPRSLGLGPVIEVDTSAPVDIARLVGTLTQMLAPG